MFQKGREESPVSIGNTCPPNELLRHKVPFNFEEEEEKERSLNADSYLNLSTTDERGSWCLTGWQSQEEIS